MNEFPYLPGTAHPDLEDVAETVRNYMTCGRTTIKYYRAPKLSPGYLYGTDKLDGTTPIKTESLVVSCRCQGLAPYVGRPFVYRWLVATDIKNRWVVGESQITYIPEELSI